MSYFSVILAVMLTLLHIQIKEKQNKDLLLIMMILMHFYYNLMERRLGICACRWNSLIYCVLNHQKISLRNKLVKCRKFSQVISTKVISCTCLVESFISVALHQSMINLELTIHSTSQFQTNSVTPGTISSKTIFLINFKLFAIQIFLSGNLFLKRFLTIQLRQKSFISKWLITLVIIWKRKVFIRNFMRDGHRGFWSEDKLHKKYCRRMTQIMSVK